MKGHLTNLQRKRKALLLLPLMVIPFLTMAFWAMGGGKEDAEKMESKPEGLNLQLPGAQLSEDREKTKLGFYEAQETLDTPDTESIVDVPFGEGRPVPADDKMRAATDATRYDPAPPGAFSYKDPHEEKVYRKLEELNKELTDQTSSEKTKRTPPSPAQRVVVETEDVNRLERMVQTVQSKGEKDPELEQLNAMMETILDIQHPDRMKDKLKEASLQHQKQVYPVETFQKEVVATLLGSGNNSDTARAPNAFFDERSSAAEDTPTPNAIIAVVQGDQQLTSGSTIKLRLLTDVYVAGTWIPKGSFVFGVATLAEDRLKISIESLRYGNSLFPVSLAVYDLDGIEGIHIPGSPTRDVAKGSAEHSLQSIGLVSLDPTLKGQATAAGIQAAKGLLSKKVKQVRVIVKTGYQVLLKDRNSQQ